MIKDTCFKMAVFKMARLVASAGAVSVLCLWFWSDAVAGSLGDGNPGDDASYRLDGTLTQGGLLLGRVAAGSRVALDGESVPVAGDGRFVIGLGREAGPSVRLVIDAPDGHRHQHDLAVVSRTYDLEKIEGLPPKKVTPDADALARIQQDRAAIVTARQGHAQTPLLMTTPTMLWPVIGRVSGVYGSQRILNGVPRSPHLGVDIAAPTGTMVRAPAPGRVILLDDDMFFTGGTVMLDHGHGVTSVYAHLDQILVAPDQSVAPGDAIGTVGATGRATGPHLHWGVHWRGVGVDPALLAGAMPTPSDVSPHSP